MCFLLLICLVMHWCWKMSSLFTSQINSLHTFANYITALPVNNIHLSLLHQCLKCHQNAYIQKVTTFMICVTGQHEEHHKPAEIHNLLLLMIQKQQAVTVVQKHLLNLMCDAVCFFHVTLTILNHNVVTKFMFS